MKSFVSSLLTGVLSAVMVLMFGGLLAQPVPADTLRAIAPTHLLLWIIAIVAIAPFAPQFAAAWWQQSKGTMTAVRGLVAIVGQRTGGSSSWKSIAVALVLGVAIGLLARGGIPFPDIDWNPVPPSPTVPAPVDPPPAPAPAKVTAVTYVYEKDEGGIPSGVAAALDQLNRQEIAATTFEKDTTDSSGSVPTQYKLAKAEAEKQGLPALVVQAGDKVLRVVLKPTTQQHVLDAAK